MTEEQNLQVMEHQPLVRSVVTKYGTRIPHHIEFDDLISEGVLGLIDAVQKFDPNKNVPLGADARVRVNGAIIDGLPATS